ncbi:MAG TPA: endopeptidase La [Chloroflexota bacterium]|nr:endopeptidase La [Chloroflexota bacterium]
MAAVDVLEKPRRRSRRPKESEVVELAVLPVRDRVLYPQMVTPLPVGRPGSLRAIEHALTRDQTIFIVAQKDPEQDEVGPDDLYPVGTESVIGRVLKLPDGNSSVLVQGQRRMRAIEFIRDEQMLRVRAVPLPDKEREPADSAELMKNVLAVFEQCVKLNKNLPEDAYVAAMNVDSPGRLADLVASTVDLDTPTRQGLLEILDPVDRLERVSQLLSKELSLLELESQIQSDVQKEVDRSQREFFLREQLKTIEKELGEIESGNKDVDELREKIAKAGMPEAVEQRARKELERLQLMPSAAPEVGVIRTYVDWLVALPWSTRTDDRLDIKEAANVLEEHHHGLSKVKERILEYMAVRKLSPKMRSPILCFVGPPGVGKTSLGRSIATALGRKFVRVSLGGVRDEAEIRGHRRTYVGALPGRIIQTMRQAGSVNPVFMLDEVDKLGMDFRGDPSSALLEVLDPEQNSHFSDHYLEVPFDLSQVIFIATANVLDPIPPPLRDRMEVIDLPGYIEDEKLSIAKRFLVARQLAEHGLTPEHVRFTDGALRRIISDYTREAGVRNLEREIANVCRKIARRVAETSKEGTAPPPDEPTVINPAALARYLGPKQFTSNAAEERDEVGVATGVTWSPVGGDLMAVEVSLLEGKGNLILTGQLGETMRESAQAAFSYARSRARALELPDSFHEKTDVHIHFPSGAIPKDGPSAGITVATALVSAATRRPVKREVAMTGELTLRGRVLPIGGLKEKVLAAHRAGIRRFILPDRNRKDLVDVPADVQRQMEFIFVDHMDAVLPVALHAL